MASGLKCCHCGTRMTAISNRGVTIDWCEFCQGLWFDPAELTHALTNGLEPLRGPGAFERALPRLGDSVLSCPRCRPQSMVSVGWLDLVLTQCPKCHGLYLTRYALAGLQEQFQRGPRHLSSGEIGGALTSAGEGLSRWAELLWLVVRTLGQVKLGGPSAKPGAGMPSPHPFSPRSTR